MCVRVERQPAHMLDHVSNRLTFDLSTPRQTQTDGERGKVGHGDEQKADKCRGGKTEMAEVPKSEQKGVNEGEGRRERVE